MRDPTVVLVALLLLVAPVAPVVATAPQDAGAGAVAAHGGPPVARTSAVPAARTSPARTSRTDDRAAATTRAGANGTNDSDGRVAGDWPVRGGGPTRTRFAPGAGLLRDPVEVANLSADVGVFAAPSVGDVDGDGGNEVVYASNDGIVRVGDPGTGDILWRAETVGRQDGGAPAIADVDGDDGAEVIVGGGNLHAFDGVTGDLEWNVSLGGDPDLKVFSDAAPVAADIDDDGVVEVVSNGDEFDRGAGVVAVDGRDGSVEWHVDRGDGQSDPALADLDGDSATEVVVGLNSGTPRMVRIDGATGNVTWEFVVPEPADTTSAPSLADTDGDGEREVVFTKDQESFGRVYALAANGTVEWNVTAPLEDRTEVTRWAPAVGDVDGDGGADVVVVGRQQVFALDGADGAPLWTRRQDEITVDRTTPSLARAPALADIDGDGATEAVVGAKHDDAVVAFDGATGVVEWGIPLGNVSVNNLRTEPVVADTDGDGLLEVLGGAGFHSQPSGVFVLDDRDGNPPTNGSLAVRRTAPRILRSPGEATLTVVGSGLSGASMTLVSPAGERFEPRSSAGGARSLRGRFAVPRTVGVWNLTVRKGDEVRRLPVLVPPRGPLVDTDATWPSGIVPGRTTEMAVSLRNHGVDDGVAVVAVQFPNYTAVESVEPGEGGTVLVNESNRVILAQPVRADGGAAWASVEYRVRADRVAFPGEDPGAGTVAIDDEVATGVAMHLGTLTREEWRAVRDESPLDVIVRATNTTNRRLLRAGATMNRTSSGRDLYRVMNASSTGADSRYVPLLLHRTSETLWQLYPAWNASRNGSATTSPDRRPVAPPRALAAPGRVPIAPRYGRGLPPAQLRSGALQSDGEDRDCWKILGRSAFNAAAKYTGAPVELQKGGVKGTLPGPFSTGISYSTKEGEKGGLSVKTPGAKDIPSVVEEGATRIADRAADDAVSYHKQYAATGKTSKFLKGRSLRSAKTAGKARKIASKAGKAAKVVSAFMAGWELGSGGREYINCLLDEQGLDTTYSELMGSGIRKTYPDATENAAEVVNAVEQDWEWAKWKWCDWFDCDYGDSSAELVSSFDPNDIRATPAGVGPDGHVRADGRLRYRVRFENLENATAAARDVTVTVRVDRNLSVASVRPLATSHPNVSVVSRNPDARTVTWEFSGIDLPPNEEPPEGEGWLTFSAAPRRDAPAGATITQNASIQFDSNPPIETNVSVRRLDRGPPETRVGSMDAVQPREMTVPWNGSDDRGGAGLTNVTLFVANGTNASFRPVASTNRSVRTVNGTVVAGTRNGTFTVEGEPGTTYRLLTLSADRLGRVERLPAAADATVTVNTAPTADPQTTGSTVAGESVTFEAGASDEVGEVTAIRWRFGDGETATGPSPSHTYAEPGTYDVTVVVEDDLGATTNASFTVEVGQAETPGGTADGTGTVATTAGDGGGGFSLGPLVVGGVVALVVIAGGALFAGRRFGG